jgi:glycosyltransferase involved in cell wall biosynthesis
LAAVTTEAPRAPRKIAVVPAFNEESSVAAVLEALYPKVDELLVVDDGSTDGTRAAIQAWLPGRDSAILVAFETNRGMSAAYYAAFGNLRARLQNGTLHDDDLVFTIDADGQHDLAVLDALERVMVDERLDALIARRNLSYHGWFKRAGNNLISAWASLWAGSTLHDIESGYRIFRLGALVDALGYYEGFRYSETVEVAVVLARLGYRVRNDIEVAVPVHRSRTRLLDAVIDIAAIPCAALRVLVRTRGDAHPRRRRAG